VNTYNKIYSENKNVFGLKPTAILETALKVVSNKSIALDIGAGQGRDTIFLAKSGFAVDSIEKSDVAINYLKSLNNSNICPIQTRIEDFDIVEDRYDLINAINVLQFVEDENIPNVTTKIKAGLKSGGVVVIASFTEEDPSFLEQSFKKYFAKGELKKLFSDFEIIFYREKLVDDNPHGGTPYPHQHGAVEVVARKR